jgi:hypothetical protein
MLAKQREVWWPWLQTRREESRPAAVTAHTCTAHTGKHHERTSTYMPLGSTPRFLRARAHTHTHTHTHSALAYTYMHRELTWTQMPVRFNSSLRPMNSLRASSSWLVTTYVHVCAHEYAYVSIENYDAYQVFAAYSFCAYRCIIYIYIYIYIYCTCKYTK